MMSVVITFIFIYCIFLSRVNDYIFLLGWVLTLVNLFLLYKKKLAFTRVDFFILCYLFYDFISVFTGYNKGPAFNCFINSYVIISFYFVCRQSLVTINDTKKTILLITLFSSILPLLNLLPFFRIYNNLQHLQLNSYISDFKFVFTPLGMSNNAWSTFLIFIFLIHSLCLFVFRDSIKVIVSVIPGFSACVFLLVNSFTRGVYICLLIYVICFGLILYKWHLSKKIKVIALLSLFIMIGISSYMYIDDVLKTIKINETFSQQRSLNGRFSSAHESLNIFSDSPLIGVGSGNFSFAENFYERDNDVVTSFSGNTLLQILAEKGIIGLVIISFILLSIFIDVIRYKGIYYIEKLIFISFFSIIIIREMTFPSILSNSASQSLFFFFIFIVQCYFTTGRYILKKSIWMILFPLLISTCIFVSYCLYINNSDQIFSEKCIESIERKNLGEAKSYLDKTSECMVPNINRSILYWKLYKRNHKNENLTISKDFIVSCVKKSPNDYVLQHNLAKIYDAEGFSNKSDSIMISLINKYPNKPLFRLINASRMKTLNVDLPYILIDNPNIVQSEYYKFFALHEQISQAELKNNIRKLSEKILLSNDPIKCAKYGKLLIWVGDTLNANFFLMKSIQLLPNLIEPRFNLSITSRYQNNKKMELLYLNQYKALTRKTLEKDYYQICIDETYYNNFQFWYGGPTSPNNIIFY